jgi:hypothetical protein
VEGAMDKTYLVNRKYEFWSDSPNITKEEHETIVDEIERGLRKIKNDLEYDYGIKIDFELSNIEEPFNGK